jgi:hypothetical protein
LRDLHQGGKNAKIIHYSGIGGEFYSFAVHLSANTLTVTDCGDANPGTAGQLRNLINTSADGDTIVIPATCPTIALKGPACDVINVSGDLDITSKSLTIKAKGLM